MKSNYYLLLLLLGISGNTFSQEPIEFKKYFFGIEGSLSFYANTFTTESTNSTSNRQVRSTSFTGRSGGGGGRGKLLLGYRINEKVVAGISFGTGILGSGIDTDYETSEVYDTGTYTDNDRILLNHSYHEYGTFIKYRLRALATRKKQRNFNARGSFSYLRRIPSKGIFYQEHSWPIFGVTFSNTSNDTPAKYDDISLLKTKDWTHFSIGLEYESRGKFGINYAFDMGFTQPNIFSEHSETLEE